MEVQSEYLETPLVDGSLSRHYVVVWLIELLGKFEHLEYSLMKSKVPIEAWEDEANPWWRSLDSAYVEEELYNLMNEIAPVGYYFGPTLDLTFEGLDWWGFWLI